MSYATPTEFRVHLGETILGQLGDDAGTGVQLDTLLQSVLNDASMYIDGYLGGIYVVPVTDVGAVAILRPHCLIIAKTLLIERKLAGRYDTEGSRLFDATKEWLARVAKRQVSISGADTPEISTTASGGRYGSDVCVFGDPNTSGSGGALL